MAPADNVADVPQTRTKRRTSTPSKPKSAPPSKLWVPALMFSLLFIGTLVIVANYFGMLIGGENNGFLLIGIAYVTGGFIVATMLH